MKTRVIGLLAAVLAMAVLVIAPWAPPPLAQGRSGDQQMARTRFVSDGVTANGTGVLQTGDVGTLSAAVATATLTEVVAAPAAGLSVYLRGIWLEKSTATTGSALVRYGTGTNCVTGTTTILTIGPQTASSLLPIGYYPVNALIPAAKALCLGTDAATTSVRALTN